MDIMDDEVPAATGGRITHGVLVRLAPRPGRHDDAEELLDAVLRLSNNEPHTETSLLLRFHNGDYGLLDLFTDELARREHLAGAARQAIAYRARDLFEGEPGNVLVDVLDHHLPPVAGRTRLAAGTWLTFATGAVRPDETVRVSAGGRVAWLALRFDDGPVAVLDLAPTADGPEPNRLPEVFCNGQEVRLVSSERFRLIGPDVPEPAIVVERPIGIVSRAAPLPSQV